MSKTIRIVNNGQPAHLTEITNAETGEMIPNVASISINLDVEMVPTAIITTYMPIVDVIIDAEIKQVCPCCGRPVEDKGEN